MNINTLIEIVRRLPGVYVDSHVIERTYGERTKLELVVTCDEQPTPYEILVRIEPTPPEQIADFERLDLPPSEPLDLPKTFSDAGITISACADCGAPGDYRRSRYCDECFAERNPF